MRVHDNCVYRLSVLNIIMVLLQTDDEGWLTKCILRMIP